MSTVIHSDRLGRAQRLALLVTVCSLVLVSVSPPASAASSPPSSLPREVQGLLGGLVLGRPDPGEGGWPPRSVGPSGPSGPQLSPPPPASPPPAFAPVKAQQPRIRLEDPKDDDPAVLQQVRAVEGVSFAAAMRIGDMPVAGRKGPTTVRMAAVDPQDFRVLTPQVTADAVAVWERLVAGDAAFTHDAGHRLEVPLGSEVPAAGHTTLRIGAYASNGVPPVADAIVSEATAQRLGLQGRPQLLIAVTEDADPTQVAARVVDVVGGRAAVLEPPGVQRAFLTGSDARKAFEPYTYIDNGDGTIQIDPAWVQRNIVNARMPIFRGEVRCHRLMITQLRGALQEVADRGLAHLINPSQYGGCWVPRHIDWNPSKPLSMHSWGLAIDFNVSTNQLGAVPTMDPRIVEIFQRWGFTWGGRWHRPDGMHFELGALLNGPRG